MAGSLVKYRTDGDRLDTACFLAQRKIKSCSLPDFAFRPDSAIVTADYARHRCQADAGALKFISPVQALNRLEQFVRVVHVKPDTVVTHMVNHFAVLVR